MTARAAGLAPDVPLAPTLIALGGLGLVLGSLGAGLPAWAFAVGFGALLLLLLSFFRIEAALAALLVGAPLIGWKAAGPVPLDSVTLGVGLLLAAAAVDFLRRGAEDRRGAFALPFALFLTVGALSLMFAPDRVEGITVWVRYAGYFLLVYAVARAVRSREHIVAYAGLALAAGAVSTLVGLEQYLNRPELSIGMAGLDLSIKGRMAGTYENPNFFGEYLVLLIPLGVAFALAPGGAVRRLSFAALGLILTAALVLTYTRGSWLSLAVGLAFFALFTKRWLLWMFGAAALAALAALPALASRLLSSFDLSEGTGAFRLKLWRIPLQMIADHPALGVGIGNYLAVFTDYVFRDPSLSVGWVQYGAHNSYLTIWAEMGTLGLLALLLVAGAALRSGLSFHRRVAGKDAFLEYVNAALMAGVVGFLLNSLTSNSLLHPRAAVFFWVLVGLQLGMSRLTPRESGERRSSVLVGSRLLGSAEALVARAGAAARASFVLSPAYALAATHRHSRLLDRFLAYPPGYSALSGSAILGLGLSLWERARRRASGSAVLGGASHLSDRPALGWGLFCVAGALGYALTYLV